MSQAFSDFNNNIANPDRVIAEGLGWPLLTTVQVLATGGPVIPQTAVPPNLAIQLAYVAARWGDASEAERRIQIDGFVQAIMEPMAQGAVGGMIIAPGAINGLLRVVAEQHVAANVNRVGHGHLDYLIATQLAGADNVLRPSVIIEAKANIDNLTRDFGQWQLCAELATARQIALGNRRRTRGVLSDGRYWRFYELDTGALLLRPTLTRTNAYDATNGGDQISIIRLLQQFIANYNTAAALL